MPSIVSSPVTANRLAPPSPLARVRPPSSPRVAATRTNSDSAHRESSTKPSKGHTDEDHRDASHLHLPQATQQHQHQRSQEKSKSQLGVSSTATTPSSGIDVSTPSPLDTSSAGIVALAPPSPALKRQHQNSQGSNGTGVTGHERRFRRRFPGVGVDEDLVDHYSCALLSDILLQGVLYISPKFFAFYSNIFGYKTQLLMPLSDVVKITKERTAKIIPNAVGVTMVGNQKYVFGSLLTRDATFKTMFKVWTQVVDPDEVSPVEDSETDNLSAPHQPGSDEEEVERTKKSPAGTPLIMEGSGVLVPPFTPPLSPAIDLTPTMEANKKEANAVTSCQWLPAKEFLGKVEDVCMSLYKLPRTSMMLLISTLLLVVLFTSASIVMYRITLVHRRISAAERRHPEWISRWNTYQDIHSKQNKVLNEEVERLTGQLKQTIDQLNQMRLPLEELVASVSTLPDYCRPFSETDKPSQQPPRHRHSRSQPLTVSKTKKDRNYDNNWVPVTS